ncbi:hypothetical protein T492DRAFT_1152478 [Pavlovales sp. CCMP2436]|nr:hypothetical protein T492DRAFT_1152478 [Pavlovales sp. CCMP2436]
MDVNQGSDGLSVTEWTYLLVESEVHATSGPLEAARSRLGSSSSKTARTIASATSTLAPTGRSAFASSTASAARMGSATAACVGFRSQPTAGQSVVGEAELESQGDAACDNATFAHRALDAAVSSNVPKRGHPSSRKSDILSSAHGKQRASNAPPNSEPALLPSPIAAQQLRGAALRSAHALRSGAALRSACTAIHASSARCIGHGHAESVMAGGKNTMDGELSGLLSEIEQSTKHSYEQLCTAVRMVPIFAEAELFGDGACGAIELALPAGSAGGFRAEGCNLDGSWRELRHVALPTPPDGGQQCYLLHTVPTLTYALSAEWLSDPKREAALWRRTRDLADLDTRPLGSHAGWSSFDAEAAMARLVLAQLLVQNRYIVRSVSDEAFIAWPSRDRHQLWATLWLALRLLPGFEYTPRELECFCGCHLVKAGAFLHM